jgi:hypothetical protein
VGRVVNPFGIVIFGRTKVITVGDNTVAGTTDRFATAAALKPAEKTEALLVSSTEVATFESKPDPVRVTFSPELTAATVVEISLSVPGIWNATGEGSFAPAV